MYEPQHLKRWTMPDHYFGEVWPDYYSSGVGQFRDSDALERSNFIVMLRELGGETETVFIVRESHWLVGWVEWIAIHATDEDRLKIADEQKARLADYPILDEGHFSETECEDANQTWTNCFNNQERIDYIRKFRDQFEFHDLADMIACVRGKYFAGCASEFLS